MVRVRAGWGRGMNSAPGAEVARVYWFDFADVIRRRHISNSANAKITQYIILGTYVFDSYLPTLMFT